MDSNEYSYKKLPPPLEEPFPEAERILETEMRKETSKRSVDTELLDMLEAAIKDEKEAAALYGQLSEMALNEKDSEILRRIRLDELKHEKLFSHIYRKLAGDVPPVAVDPNYLSRNLKRNLSDALFHETEDVEFYRKIMFSLSDSVDRDIIYEIITDEQNHALKVLYLLTEY